MGGLDRLSNCTPITTSLKIYIFQLDIISRGTFQPFV